MAIDKKLRIYDENGVEVDYDVLASDVKLSDGTPLPDKLAAMQEDIEEAASQGGITRETDPTVSSWAKQPEKPTYTAQEVGAVPSEGYVPLTQAEKEKLGALPTSSELTTQLGGKVDKVPGYGLSKNDYSDAEKTKVAGAVQSVSVNGGEPQLPDQNGNIDIECVDGITPHIDVVTGHWFIGNTNTGIPARGPQGNSGYTGAVGELEVVNNLTDGGAAKALSAEQGKLMAIKSIPEAGSFAEAYEKARENNVVFPWFLRDTDENGNPIEKMIWHNGYRKFVDAIGAEVVGQKNGLTIKVNEDCDLLLGSTTYPLTKGVNNLPFDSEGINWDGTSVISTFDIRESGTTTSNKTYAEEIDFGGLKVYVGYQFLYNWDSLTKIKRLCIELNRNASDVFRSMDNLSEIQMTGRVEGGNGTFVMQMFSGCSRLLRADLSGVTVGFAGVRGINSLFNDCSVLEYVDIRNVNTASATSFENAFKNNYALKTLIIGNFDNSAVTSIQNAFLGVRDCVLICTTSNPPTLNTEYDWITTTETINGVEQDICHFSAIYVPTAAVNDYKAATGWSEYASIIDDIANYNG